MAKEKENKVKNDNKHFMKDVKAELKRVSWPTSKQMVSNVTAVITIVLVTAIIVFCLDFVFGAMNKYGVEKLKDKVQSKNESQVQINDDNSSDEQSNSNESADNAENTEGQTNTENTQNADNTENN